jgi:hypothetical protein
MRRVVSTLAFALMIPLAACDSGTPTETAATVSGTYHLETVNGQPLPFLFAEAGIDRLEVVAGYIRFDVNGRFEDSLTLRVTENGDVEEVPEVLEGNWTQAGGTVTLTVDGGGDYPLQLSGETLTQVINQFVLVYRK